MDKHTARATAIVGHMRAAGARALVLHHTGVIFHHTASLRRAPRAGRFDMYELPEPNVLARMLSSGVVRNAARRVVNYGPVK